MVKQGDRPIFHLALHVAKLLEERLRPDEGEGLPTGQARFVDALARSGSQTVSALARALHIAQPSASVLAQRLERDGLVRRARSDDARSWQISLTPKRRSATAAVHAAWSDTEAALRATVTPAEALVLRRLLTRVRDGLGGRSPAFDQLRPNGPNDDSRRRR